MYLSGDLSPICIRSSRLTLRPLTLADAAECFAEANARIAKYMSWNPPASESEHNAICRELLEDISTGKNLELVIRGQSSGEFIGRAGLHSGDADLLETGVWIKESAQGRGYGREAVAAVIEWASAVFRPSGFLWPVVDENMPSRRLAEALAGKIIGTRQMQKAG